MFLLTAEEANLYTFQNRSWHSRADKLWRLILLLFLSKLKLRYARGLLHIVSHFMIRVLYSCYYLNML